MLSVHLTQTVLGAVFCWVCLRVYQGDVPDVLAGRWPVCLALLALAWMITLPLFAWLWSLLITIDRRLSFWTLYWLGLLGPLLLVVALVLTVSLFRARDVPNRARSFLLLGAVTTWPIMQIAAYFACSKALPMTLVEQASLTPYWSVVCVYGLCLVLPLALVSVALRVRRARLVHAASAGHLVGGKGLLMPGEAVVWGRVQLAEGEAQAVRLEVDQLGSEAESSGTWSHTWTETSRRLTVRPFYLRTPAGERVRVLAGDNPQLMDALDGKILVNRTLRTCIAELTPRESVTAFGELLRARDPEAAPEGYRSAAIGWVLQPPAGGRMLLCSYPIDRPFVESARRILVHVVLLLAVVAVGQCALIDYHLRVAFGQVVDASVTQARLVERETEEGKEIERHVTVALASSQTLSHEVTRDSFANATVGGRVPVLRDPRFGSLQFGEHPTTTFWTAVLAGLCALFSLLLGLSNRPDAEWYSKATLEDQGSGRLPEPTPTQRTGDAEIRELVDQALRPKS
jgi:hypothetical protein